MTKRPLLLMSLLFIPGEMMAISNMRLFGILMAIGIGMFCLQFCKECKTYVFLLPFFFAFTLGALLAFDARGPEVFDDLCETGLPNVFVQGTVCEMDRSQTGYKVYLKDLKCTVDNGKANVHSENIRHKIMFQTDALDIRLGQRVMCKGTLCMFEHARNPGGFDAFSYYRSRKVDYQMQVEECCVLDADYWKLQDSLRCLRDKVVTQIQLLVGDEDAGFFEAVLLGEKADLDADLKEQYQLAGIAHIIAISGLHLGLLGVGLFRLLRKWTVPPLPSAVIAGGLIFVYGIFTGMSGSCKRAIIMMLIAFLGQVIFRAYDLLSAMAFAALVILVMYPLQLMDAGFLLSFGAIIGIGILDEIKKVRSEQQRILDENKELIGEEQRNSNENKKLKSEEVRKQNENKELIGEEVGKQNENKKLKSEEVRKQNENKKLKSEEVRKQNENLRGVQARILNSLITSLMIQAVTLPVIMWFYHEIPMYSVLLNLVVIPLMSLLIPLALFAILLSLVWFDAGVVLMKPAVMIVHFYNALAKGANRLPYAHLVTGKPEVWQIVIYVIVVGLVMGLVCLWRRKHFRIWIGSALALIFVGVLIYPGNTNLKITMLDVGQGDGLVIRTPENKIILMDGGSSSEKKLYQYTYRPYLLSQGITDIDMVIVSHGDNDHISGIIELMEHRYPIGKLVLPDIANPDEHYQTLQSMAQQSGIPILYLSRGQVITEGELVLTCLHPTQNYQCEDPNAYSTTLSLRYKDFSMLFTGDLGEDAEQDVTEYMAKRSEGSEEKNKKENKLESMSEYEEENNLEGILEYGEGKKQEDVSEYEEGKKQEDMSEYEEENQLRSTTEHRLEYVNEFCDYTVLKVGHHGSKTSTSMKFLQQVHPRYALISAGRNNRYGHPHAVTLQSLEECGAEVKNTQTEGAICLETDGKVLRWK